MRFALSTGTLYIYPLRTVLRWARQAGFYGVELVVNPEVIARGGDGVRDLAAREGVPICSVHPTVIPLPGWRERRGGMEQTIPLALKAGARTVVMHTPRAESLDRGEGLAFRRRIERWQPRLAGSGLRLAVENKTIHAPADLRYALTPVERLRAFADRHDLDLVLDTAHAGTADLDLLYVWQVFEGRLAEVHLSDQGGPLPLGNWARMHKVLDEHRFPGSGDLPLAELVAALAAAGYAGTVVLEVSPVALRFWWPPAIRRRLAQAIVWLRRAAGSQEAA